MSNLALNKLRLFGGVPGGNGGGVYVYITGMETAQDSRDEVDTVTAPVVLSLSHVTAQDNMALEGTEGGGVFRASRITGCRCTASTLRVATSAAVCWLTMT
jgi:hypothetical protein